MRTLPFKALYPNKDLVVSANSFFNTMGKDFSKHFEAGLFIEDIDEAIYAYQVRKAKKKYHGIILNTDIRDILEGNILFHEETMLDKEHDMVQTTIEKKSMIKPVLLFYKANKKLSKLIDKIIDTKEVFYFCDLQNGTRHSFWKVNSQKKIKLIQSIFKHHIPKAYIADGHHRCSSTERLYLEQSNQFPDLDFSSMLSAYFPMKQLEIFDHIKIVSIFENVKANIFLSKLSKYAKIKRIKKFKLPQKKYELIININHANYKIRWKKSVIKKFKKKGQELDVFITDKIILKKILKILEVRNNNRVSYYSGLESPKNIIKNSAHQTNAIAIFQAPMMLKDIKKIADKGLFLPPKSTWFEPRIKSGVIATKFNK